MIGCGQELCLTSGCQLNRDKGEEEDDNGDMEAGSPQFVNRTDQTST